MYSKVHIIALFESFVNIVSVYTLKTLNFKVVELGSRWKYEKAALVFLKCIVNLKNKYQILSVWNQSNWCHIYSTHILHLLGIRMILVLKICNLVLSHRPNELFSGGPFQLSVERGKYKCRPVDCKQHGVHTVTPGLKICRFLWAREPILGWRLN